MQYSELLNVLYLHIPKVVADALNLSLVHNFDPFIASKTFYKPNVFWKPYFLLQKHNLHWSV